MQVFEVVIGLLLLGIALASIARRIGAPYPALVALAGAALALVPGVPALVLDPELALALFVAPVLIDAAYDSSPRDLRANWRAIASLAFGAVVLTIIFVAIAARMLVPEIPWAAAVALGAIVAPPDAAAATTVLKQLRPPQRLLVILEGESLFNDASALLVYRLAVAATLTGTLSGWGVVPTFLGVTVGSFLLGVFFSRVITFISARIRDLPTAVVMQFCTTFGIWILAEQLHLSGIITLVVFAMIVARRAPEFMTARLRIPAWAVWEVAVFVLNLLAFILVGFQLKPILERLDGDARIHFAAVGAMITAVVIAARILWVIAAAAFSRWWCRAKIQGSARAEDIVGLSGKGAVIVGWCGMRGTVTLAAALALPIEFPHRDLILTTAFAVTLGTLVFQGLTLRPLMLWLKLRDDGSVEREVKLARGDTLRAAIAATQQFPDADAAALLRARFESQLARADTPAGETAGFTGGEPEIIRAATDAQRSCLVSLRKSGAIGDAAFQRVEEELDWTELGWQSLLQQSTVTVAATDE